MSASSHLCPPPHSYLQDLAELGLELKVGAALANGPPEGLLQGLHPSLCLLAQLCHPLVLPLATKPLLLRLVHLAQVGRMINVTELGDMLLPLSLAPKLPLQMLPWGKPLLSAEPGKGMDPETHRIMGLCTCYCYLHYCRSVFLLLGGCWALWTTCKLVGNVSLGTFATVLVLREPSVPEEPQ